jgi:hypothetical protein
MSARRKWDSSNPSLASECAPPPRTGGGGRVGGDTSLRVRSWESPNSDDWRKSLALNLLCEKPAKEQLAEYFPYHGSWNGSSLHQAAAPVEMFSSRGI